MTKRRRCRQTSHQSTAPVIGFSTGGHKSFETVTSAEGHPSHPELAPDPAAELARAAASGDAAAAGRLLKVVAPRVAGVTRAILGPGHPDLDDANQQALIALLGALSAFRGECSTASYAARIAVRVAVHVRRKSRAVRQRTDVIAQMEPPPDSVPTPGAESQSQRRKDLLRELLAEIPEEQAEALALRAVLGWSLEEVASASGVPLNTVRSRVRLAKEALRRRIEADPTLHESLGLEP